MAQVPSEISQQQGTYSVFKSGIVNNNSSTPIPYPDFNETIYFGGDSKDFKDIIYNSKIRETLNLPIEILTNDSKISRLARRNERGVTKRIPRPQNPWIIYRRDKHASPEFEGIKSSIASIKIGEMWKNESKDVLEYFVALSLLASENHFKKYGKEYRYQPKQRGSKKSIKKQQKQQKQQKEEKRVKSKENIKNILTETMIPTPEESPETLMHQAFPQFSITPSSPLSIQSPISNYLPTPASSIQHSPAEDFFVEQFISPATSTSDEDFSIEQFISPVSQEVFKQFMMMYQTCPPLSDINPSHVASEEQPLLNGNFSEFLSNAENLTSLTTNIETTSNIETSTPEFDFYLYPGCLESTMDMDMDLQTPVNNGYFFNPSLCDPLEWQITNDTPFFPEQMDHSYGYNTEQPSL